MALSAGASVLRPLPLVDANDLVVHDSDNDTDNNYKAVTVLVIVTALWSMSILKSTGIKKYPTALRSS